MDETVPTSKDEPKPNEPTASEKETPENVIDENSLPKKRVLVFKGERDWGSIVEYILLAITAFLAFVTWKTARYAADQAGAAIESNRITLQEMNYRHLKDSTDNIIQRFKDSIQREDDSVGWAYQRAKDSIVLSSIRSSNSKEWKGLQIYTERTRVDLRPFVVINRIDSLIYTPDSEIVAQFSFVNIGKTPAINVHCAHHMLFDERFMQVEADTISMMLKKLRWRSEGSLGTGMYRLVTHSSGKVIIPQNSNWGFGRFPQVFLLVGIEYSDMFGNIDSTWNCFIFDNTRSPDYYTRFNVFK